MTKGSGICLICNTTDNFPRDSGTGDVLAASPHASCSPWTACNGHKLPWILHSLASCYTPLKWQLLILFWILLKMETLTGPDPLSSAAHHALGHGSSTLLGLGRH